MPVTRIADAKEDMDAWKVARRSLFTSSEVYSLLDIDRPAWWSDDFDSVVAGKRTGEDKEFDSETETTIAHGTFDEENIQAKFGYAVGCEVMPDNGLYVNDRWPKIGASIDGIGRPSKDAEVFPEFSHDRMMLPLLRAEIDERNSKFITEIKKSLSVKWQSSTPEYYVSQVKTQLAVLELPYAVIIAETVKKGQAQKWRQFWDMRAYIIERDPSWDTVLDGLNQVALDTLGE